MRVDSRACERLPGWMRLACLTAMLLATTSHSVAQTTTDKLAAAAQNPAPVNVLEIDGGYRFSFLSGGQSESYYRLSYNGALVRSAGTPFKYSQGLDLETPVRTTGAGDRNQIEVRLENGTTTAGGGLFEANGVRPLSLRGLEPLNLRGTALLAGDTDGKNIQLAVGLETPPGRLPGLSGIGASNWFVVGVNAHRQEAADSTSSDKNLGLVTFRTFAGKAFGWRKSDNPEEIAGRIAAQFLREAPTYAEAQALAAKIQQISANRRTSLQQLFLDAVTEAGSADQWERTVRDLAFGNTDAVTDQPTFALYAESSGWVAILENFGGSRFKSLLTASADYWFLPRRDDVFLRLRYEYGFEHATPMELKNHLLLSVSFRL